MIGGGHNGLTAACYLAGAGLSVAVLERHSVVGGAAVTEELIPGFRVSTGSYVLSLMPRRILDELDLWSAGLQYLDRDPRIFVPFPDGTSLTWWGDPARRDAELAKISKRDADPLRGLRGVHRAGGGGDGPVHPPEPALVGRGGGRVPRARATSRSSRSASWARRPTSPSTSSRARSSRPSWRPPGSSGRSAARGTPGTGYVKLYHSMGMATGNRGAWTYVRGAMGAVTQALARVAEKRGAVIRTDAEVEGDPGPGRAGDRRRPRGRRGGRGDASSCPTPTPCGPTSGSCRAGSCPTTTGARWRRSRSRAP